MKIYCFGNEFLENDSLAKKIADDIKIEGVEFIKCSSPEEIFQEPEKEILIMDVAKGIGEPILIEDVDQLKNNNIVSLHDFDLAFFLKLMKKIGKLKKVKIIGIPMRGDKEEIKKKTISIINSVKSI
jgi:Ni,Fe-hydrogenase maturation factor